MAKLSKTVMRLQIWPTFHPVLVGDLGVAVDSVKINYRVRYWIMDSSKHDMFESMVGHERSFDSAFKTFEVQPSECKSRFELILPKFGHIAFYKYCYTVSLLDLILKVSVQSFIVSS